MGVSRGSDHQCRVRGQAGQSPLPRHRAAGDVQESEGVRPQALGGRFRRQSATENGIRSVSTRFDARKNLIVVRAEIKGPKGTAFVPLALDTGATKTLISSEALLSIGYEPTRALKSLEVMTADSIVEVPIVALKTIRCLGHV